MADSEPGERLAEITGVGAAWAIRDLGGSHPVLVGNRAVAGRVTLSPGDRVQIEKWYWVVPARSFASAPGTGLSIRLENVTFSISKRFTKRLTLLSSVTIDVQPGEFVGILGPSGSGKSTLLHLMNGDYSPSQGAILFEGESAESFLPKHRRRMGYLPQTPILHDALTVRQALQYSVRLKGLPLIEDGVSVVTAILDRVGVAHRADTPIRNISGGEKKRVALAAELLGEPSALFLDEATSGLDPALEKEMMGLFRRLADTGKSVVCITHYPDNVNFCDRLIIVAQGLVLFQGTPEEVLAHFQIERIGDLYSKLVGDITCFQNPTPLQGKPGRHQEGSASGQSKFNGFAELPLLDPGSQMITLTSRYVRLLVLDAKNLLVLVFQAPIIALLIGATFGNIAVAYSEQHAADWKQVGFLLVMSVIWCAGTNGVREIVKERTIFFHERRCGLAANSYLGSKFVPLGVISIVQTLMLLFVLGRITQFAGNWVSHSLILSLVALAATAMGLCISAGAKTSERAMTLLPIILIGQAVFSGGLARLAGFTKLLAKLCIPAFWGLNGLKATLSSNLVEATFVSSPGEYQPPVLGRGDPLWLDAFALCLHAVALLWLSSFFLRKTPTSV